ncbi:hypothetical protein V2J09_000023 [Rumex salicifolius]
MILSRLIIHVLLLSLKLSSTRDDEDVMVVVEWKQWVLQKEYGCVGELLKSWYCL